MNVEIGTVAAQFLSVNICFEFSALLLCRAAKLGKTPIRSNHLALGISLVICIYGVCTLYMYVCST
jgi:hypothetical protein